MKNKKTLARVVALALVAIMVLTTLVSALSVVLFGARPTYYYAEVVSVSEQNIKEDTNGISIRFRFSAAIQDSSLNTDPAIIANPSEAIGREYKSGRVEVGSTWWDSSASTMSYKIIGVADSSSSPAEYKFEAEITSLKYIGRYKNKTLRISNIFDNYGGSTSLFDRPISMELDDDNFHGNFSTENNDNSSSSTSTTEDDKITYTSNIVFETTVVRDVDGKVLDKIDKDTEPFSVEVVYTDTGLRNAEIRNLRGTSIQTFFVPGGSFEMTGTTQGTVQYLTNSRSAYPRFRVTYSGLTYTGTGNELNFQVYYLFNYMDDPVKGEGKAALYEAKPDDEDDDKDKMDMAVPKIIIDSYSYGEDTIIAGDEFSLNFSIRNTSAELPLENITITMTPTSNEAQKEGPGLLVASSSNTIYVPSLGVGAALPYSVAFKAKPDAEVTSHIIQIKFDYQYVDTVKKTREKAEMTESIAIPVSQIDRFYLEPVLESPYAEVGQEAYLTVNFVNRGKSSTNNIAVSIRCDNPAVTAPAENYGNLEAGKADSVDLYVTSTEAGEFSGEVVVEYEDENMNRKELTTPFTMMVDEPWFPSSDDFPPEDIFVEPISTGPAPLSIALCSIGGLGIAGPIALYLMKRVKAKGSEELFDEDI